MISCQKAWPDLRRYRASPVTGFSRDHLSMFAIYRLQKSGTLMLAQPKLTSNFINYFFSRTEFFDHSTVLQQRAKQGLFDFLPSWHGQLFKHLALVTH